MRSPGFGSSGMKVGAFLDLDALVVPLRAGGAVCNGRSRRIAGTARQMLRKAGAEL